MGSMFAANGEVIHGPSGRAAAATDIGTHISNTLIFNQPRTASPHIIARFQLDDPATSGARRLDGRARFAYWNQISSLAFIFVYSGWRITG